MNSSYDDGIAIAIAWPQTLCKKAGAWYDPLMEWLGFSKNHYYRVGHAAVVLIDRASQKCHYFDFGRYHAPFGHGRVRDEVTDHDLRISQKAVFDQQGNLNNLASILQELSANTSCHGVGDLYASTTPIGFGQAYQKAKNMQATSPIQYGPFIRRGTNCSRFVRTAILAGDPPLVDKIKLVLPLTISPTPMTNVNSLDNRIVILTTKPIIVWENQAI